MRYRLYKRYLQQDEQVPFSWLESHGFKFTGDENGVDMHGLVSFSVYTEFSEEDATLIRLTFPNAYLMPV